MIKNILLIVLSATIMGGCVNLDKPPSAKHYILDANPSTFANEGKSTNVKVLPIRIPTYLNQANLVLKLDDHQIQISNYHFWADDLRQSIQRVMIKQLNMPDSEYSFGEKCRSCKQIGIHIDHYYPSQSGEVYLSGTYTITEYNESQTQHAFSYSLPLEKGGFDESVKGMRSLLNALAANIISNM